jgi:putative peptidoglycan lipid II flippase
VLSQHAEARRFEEMRATLGFALRNVTFVMVPAAVGLIVLREPIVRALFQHRAFGADSTSLTAWALLFYALGLPALAAARLLVQAFYALEDTATPVRAAAFALVANLALCFLLVGPLGQGGLALATSLAAYLQLAFLYFVFRRQSGAVEEARLALSVGRTTAAALGMGAACWVLLREAAALGLAGTAAWLAALAVIILAGVAVFFTLAALLRAEEVGDFYTFAMGRARGEAVAGAALAPPKAGLVSTPNGK